MDKIRGDPSAQATQPVPAPQSPEASLAEQALRLSEQNYRLLIEEAPYAICRATQTGQLLQVNRSMLEMLGYSPGSEADLLIRDLPQIFLEADGFERFRLSLAGGETAQGLDSRWRCRDGRQIQVRIGGRRVHGAEDQTLYFDLWAENVTERKELEARLAQAEKMQAIGQLAGGIAHDFNNLLTVINGYCDLLIGYEKAGQARDSLEMIRQAGERAAGLTQQLLAFSRKQMTRTEVVSLGAIASEVVRLSRRVIGENIHITEDLCPAGDNIVADPAQIHQMLMNLVINARDAMPDGGRLTIATAVSDIGADSAAHLDVPHGTYVVLTVADSGAGMDEFVRAHLFEPFFTTKEKGKGTGLGLSTVYGTVRQSGGAIALESEPGRGTTFRIFLPQASSAGDAGPAEAGIPKLLGGTNTILVVEDEPAVRRFVAELLRGTGYDVLEASNGQEAISVAANHRGAIHLLLTDMMMPGMTGLQLAADLCELHPESKVVVVSGYSEGFSPAAPLAHNIRYLQKPFTPEHLTRAVREAIAGS